MAEVSKIQWTESTWNPWTGCKVASEGCHNCYMFRWAKQAGRDPEVLMRTAPRTFQAPLRWQKALAPGERKLVFTCSLSDWFHRDADPFRADAWDVIRACPDLTFQVLTKRHGRIAANLPTDWGQGWDNIWLGVSVESGPWLRRAAALNQVPAKVRFLSMEPLIAPVAQAELRAVLRDGIGWVIVGGESGAADKVRPFSERAALEIVEACRAEGVPVFVKQMGARTARLDGTQIRIPHNQLDQLPDELMVREMPR